MHIIMAGNPGVGKSFLLNTLAGKCIFPSGISIGTGKTVNFLTVNHDDLTLSDTPGLDDIRSRERAAQQISAALEQGGTFKLIFVVVLESGRVRTEDVTTIRLILRALDRVLARRKQEQQSNNNQAAAETTTTTTATTTLTANNNNNNSNNNHDNSADAGDSAAETDMTARFSVLVNKCGPKVMEQLAEQENQEIIRAYLSTTHRVDHLGFLPHREDALDRDNFLLACPEDLRTFVDGAPQITIPQRPGINIDTAQFDAEHDRLRAQIDDMNERLDSLPKRARVRSLLLELVPSLVLGIGGQLLGGLAAARLVPVAGPALARVFTYVGQALRLI